MKRLILALAAIWPLALLSQSGVPLSAQAPQAPAGELFEQSIQPIFAEHCISCHGDNDLGGLTLDSRAAMLEGGKSGPAVVPGDPDASLLIQAVRQTGAMKMPMGTDPLPADQVALLERWVREGAVWPEATVGGKPETVLTEHFETHIRPVLAQQCFACHTNSKSGGLRLDSREDILAGGATGPAMVPGDPGRSLLVAALRHSGTLKMPKGGTRLTDEQIAFFETWVKDGAYWPVDKTPVKVYTEEQKNLWSVQPLRAGTAPAVRDTAWPLNDIDRFVLARLEQDGLRPTTTADRRTLLRRVTYDLTGLMPTYEEVQAFEQDASPDAWEKVVDRLLASPQYGERWARHWMDVVRYGEDDYRVAARPDRAEKYPFAYLYRDWLIKAFNEDLPYDMFVKAQLAADLLDEQVRDRYIPALGMHGNGIWIFHANPAPIERADEWHDKVDVTSKAFLGLTVGCARCHDHKYDAIYTKDYYQMASVFASSNFKAYPRVPAAVVEEYDRQKKVLEKKEEDRKTFLENASDLYAQMLFSQAEDYMMAAWKVGTERRATVASVAEDTRLDPEILDRWVTFLRKRPDNYPALAAWQEMVSRESTEAEARTLAQAFVAKVADVNEKYQKLTKDNEVALAQVKDENEPFDPLPNGLKRRLNAYQIDLKSLDREDTLLWRDVFERDVPEATAEDAEESDKPRPGLLKLTDGALERRLPADLRLHADKLKADIEAFKKAMPPRYPEAFGIAEAAQPSDLKVFVRGNPYAFGDNAPRGSVSILNAGTPTLFTEGSGRLALAEEIVRQPIAMRVIVNRVWDWHMGRGIVNTPSNFGMAGDRPTHPELLDHLASRFIESGMSWKALHKETLMSRTYQLSAEPVTANMAKDPGNQLYWRANRMRLDSEGVWDLLLQASGTLDMTALGGPSQLLDEKMTRRAVYSKVSRMYPSDFHSTFDLPAATISTEKRYTTNVPQQRLFFLNGTVVQQQAQAIADRIAPLGSPDAQVRKVFELVYQRAPTPEELSVATAFVQKPAYRTALDAVVPVATDGVVAPERGSEPSRLPDSPLRSLCWALLSSNEFLFLD